MEVVKKERKREMGSKDLRFVSVSVCVCVCVFLFCVMKKRLMIMMCLFFFFLFFLTFSIPHIRIDIGLGLYFGCSCAARVYVCPSRNTQKKYKSYFRKKEHFNKVVWLNCILLMFSPS